MGSLSILFTTHLRTFVNSFSFRWRANSFILTSERLTRMPESILPDTLYRCNSFNTLLLSGKCFIINSATTLPSYSIFCSFNMTAQRSNNCPASSLRSPLILNSITEHLECKGSMILFLKLQVNMKRQLL